MKKAVTAGAALLMTTGIASAGGLDRSGQGIAPLFEDGNYVELSFGSVSPEVSGVGNFPAEIESGNVGVDYTQLSLAFKTDLNDQLSLAVILDQPYGANVEYDDTETGYPLADSVAEFRSRGITALGRYKFDDNISVHGGLRAVSIDADAIVTAVGYDADFDRDTQVAYVLGAAYEVPEIALRVALTYTTETEFSHDTTPANAAPGKTEYTMPQRVDLDFQTGVAEDTLLFGSIRWVEWSKTEINAHAYPANPLVSYDNDTTTYNIGVGRRFSDAFSGSVSIGYEKANGGVASNLAPTDGSTSFGVGGQYTLANGVEISGGVRYIMIGDAETALGVPDGADPNVSWEDNSAIGVGLKVAYNF